MPRHLLSLRDLGRESLDHLVRRAGHHASRRSTTLGPRERTLEGKVVGLLFLGPSTRTRTSFTSGALRLGASTIPFGREDLQVSTGESFLDTGRVLSGYLDALVVRTNRSHNQMALLAQQPEMAVINAMSDQEHPTQAIGDLATLREHFGSLDGITVLYLGEGNNTSSALAFAVAQTPGMRLLLMTPAGFGLPPDLLSEAQGLAVVHGASVEQSHDLGALPSLVDAVYTTRWQTMGEPKAVENWRTLFQPFAVTDELMAKVSRPRGTVFLHDLPAVRGEEVAASVIDGTQSVVFRQAQYKLFGAMASLEWAVGCEPALCFETEPMTAVLAAEA